MRLAILPACVACAALFSFQTVRAQEATAPAKPSEHLIGTIVSADPAKETVVLKEDSSGVEHVIQLQSARTLLKVPPGAKDLKSATRISASDLAGGDRIDVRGMKAEGDPNAIAARTVLLMSSRDLQQAHQSEAAAWQRSTAGSVVSVDAAGKALTVNVRDATGTKPVTVNASAAAFTRYSPEDPKTARPSQLGDIQPGDQVRIIGDRSSDGSSLTARKIYSGSFKTLAGTVSSVASDGKSLVIKDLSTKQAVTVTLADSSQVHKLPPPMAMMLARRFNPDMKAAPTGEGASGAAPAAGGTASARPGSADRPAGGDSGVAASSAGDAPQRRWPRSPDAAGSPDGSAAPGAPPAGRAGRMGNGDLSQMLDRLPAITTADLKTGDAVVVSGSPSTSNRSALIATAVIAGVEPIFQAAPGKQAQSLGDWGAGLAGGAAMDAGAPPQ